MYPLFLRCSRAHQIIASRLLPLGCGKTYVQAVSAVLLTLLASSGQCQAISAAQPHLPTPAAKLITKVEDQRLHYRKAKSALSRGELKTFRKHYARLGDYPLIPYLDYALLKYELHKLDFENIDSFLTRHQGSYLETLLRRQLLYTLSVKRRWKAFLRYYKPEQYNSKDMQCMWLYARLRKQDTDALPLITELWVEGKSLPEACDPLISRWRREGHLSQDLIWQRFTAAMQNRRKGLARYLSGLMNKRYNKHAQLLLQVDAYPHRIAKHRQYAGKSPLMQEVIAHGIERYARKNPVKALAQWEIYAAKQAFSPTLAKRVGTSIARQLTFKGEIAAVEQLLNQSPDLQENAVIENFIRESLKQSDWTRVLSWLDYLDENARQSNRWQYWRARAMQEMQLKPLDGKNPEEIYQQLATQRSFYGFLSADIIGSDYALQFKPVEVSSSRLYAIEQLPAMRRAKELWLTDNHAEARAEWAHMERGMSKQDLVVAGELAKRWGWYNRGIQAMITGNLWDHLSIRFPVAYEPLVLREADANDIEPNFIFAIARQESAFAEKARSSAGAMGLMQLMPRTAQATARRNGIKHRKNDLYKPAHNIAIGSRYLNQLLEQFNGNRILAAAAYNAGPHRVDRWLRRTPQDVAYDVWIETIPFRETRGYVQNVLAFSVIYGYRRGAPTSLVTENEAKSLL